MQGSGSMTFTRARCGGGEENGGARRNRTDDLLHAMQALSQLSYGPEPETTQLHPPLP